jgi:hypothetical protein
MSRVSYGGVKTLCRRTTTSCRPATLLGTLPAVTSWPGDGTDACIPLRADAVGAAVQQLLVIANATQKLPNQFRIGLGDGPHPELNGCLQRKGQAAREA